MTDRQVYFAEDGVEAPPIPVLLASGQALPQPLLDGGEIILLAIKPSMWYLVLVSVRWLIAAAVVTVLSPWLSSALPAFPQSVVMQAVLIITAFRLVVALLQWSSRLYVLTNRRVMCYHGLLHVSLFEAPLVQIRNSYVKVRAVEKPCRVGSIGFSLQGSKRIDAWWEQIADPQTVHERIRRAIEKALDSHSPLLPA